VTSNLLRSAAVFAFGFGVGLYYARLGFHPLDGSIVFDAGWRMLSGQVPIRDFTTPEAIVPGLMQAALFAVGGVDWFTYCVHAALLNGAMGAVVFGLLVRLGVRPGLATVYGLLTGLAFQPPFGVPFPELHSFFFVGVATWALVVAATTEGPVASVAARATIPTWLALALLSKANPAGYAVPLILVAAVVWRRPPRSKTGGLFALAAGALFVVVAVWTALELFDIDPATAWLDLWERPRRVGAHRVPEIGIPFVARILDRGLYREGLLLPGVMGCGLLACLLAGPRLWRTLPREQVERLCVAAGFCTVGLLYRSTALNQPMTGVGFTFASAGLVHASLLAAGTTDALRPAVRAAATVFLVVVGLDAVYLTTVVNPLRRVSDIEFRADTAHSPKTPALAFMRYQSNGFYRTTAADLDRVVAFLERHPENFLLVGDHAILYGVTHRPSVSPSLWFHDGVTAPARGSKAFAAHRKRMSDAVDEFDVAWIVVEGNRTGMYSKLDQYPSLVARIEAAGCAPVQIGNFRLHRIESRSSPVAECPAVE
jgi:hypothetical protein